MSQSSQRILNEHLPLFDLIKFVSILWQKRFLIGTVTLGFLLVTALYLVVTKPVYTATAVVLVDPRETRTTESDNVLSGLGTDSAAIASQVAVIASRELLETVFTDEKIETDPEFAQGDSSFISTLLGRTSIPSRNTIFDRFISKVSVERQGLTYVLSIGFKSSDPDKAARIVNAIVKNYIASQVNEKSAANSEVTNLLNSRIAGLQQSVSDAERAVEDYKIQYNIFDAGAGSTLVQSQIDQLNIQLLAAQEEQRQAETKYDQAMAAGASPQGLQRLTEILSSASADKLRDDYNARVSAIASAQATLGPRHPTLIALQAELGRVEAQILAEAQRITSELKASLDRSSDNLKKIQGDIEALRTQSNDANRRAVELRQLERNADASRSVLDQFQKRSQETGQLEGLQLSDARVISSATAPDQATWPKPSLLLGVAGFLGMALGSAIALLLGLAKDKDALEAAIAERPTGPAPAPQPAPGPAIRQPALTKQPVVAPPSAKSPFRLQAAPIAPPAAALPAATPTRPADERENVKSAVAEIRRSIHYARLN